MRVVRALLILLVAIAAAGAGGVVYAGLRLTAPVRRQVGPPPPELAMAQRVTFDAANGATLQGWWAPGRPGGGAVVLLHGWAGTRRDMLARAERLQSQGYGTLLFDLEAEGESNGDRVTFGPREGQDAAAAIAWVRARAPREKVGAIGQSLGGAALLLGPHPAELDAMVLESVYPTLELAFKHRLAAQLGDTAAALLLPVFEAIVPPTAGLDPAASRPVDRIGQARAPVLVANGVDDDRTTLAEAQAMFDRAPQPKQFWPVPNAGHEDLLAKAPGAYWQTVLPFLAQHLRRG